MVSYHRTDHYLIFEKLKGAAQYYLQCPTLRRLMALFFSTYSMNREKGSPSMQLRCRILVLEEVLSSLSSTEEPREARLPRIKLSYAKSFCFLHCTLHLHLILYLWLFPAHKIYIDKYRYRLVYLNNSPFRDVRAIVYAHINFSNTLLQESMNTAWLFRLLGCREKMA